MLQEHSPTNSLNECSSDKASPPTHSTFIQGATVILPICGYIHLGTDVEKASAFVQQPKPLTTKDKLELPNRSC